MHFPVFAKGSSAPFFDTRILITMPGPFLQPALWLLLAGKYSGHFHFYFLLVSKLLARLVFVLSL